MATSISKADLGGWLKLSAQVQADPEDGPILDRIAAATSSYVNDLPHVRDAVALDPAAEWDEATVTGALMLAARLYRRRNSPSGVEAFAESGVVYVAKRDPDVARLLRLNSPRVG